ncbi:hypothetical protein H6G08_28445 [Calothrix anomala FACHB-343]|uniref:Uncharacterized protein n=3 Tax=Calotrichaceae TaxID=2661849 RepID=A0ABR8AIQ7_9CYAN|nr:hypothetical protein [Calothrix parietina FACHB-288]MBD2228367.1 hypothetical protein [Calothrix anomala FACHB-343]
MNSQPKPNLNELEQFYIEEIETIKLLLAKISKRNISEIQPHLDIMLEQLIQPVIEQPCYETATPQEWIAAFQKWVESHQDMNLPTLNDEDISRESIYGERTP